jgi:plastocyanin
MHQRILALTLAAVVAGASACSSGSSGSSGGTGPGGGPLGGASATIVASGTAGGNNGYGNNGGGQFYFSPVPDTVAAGSAVTFQFRDVQHTVTFDVDPSAVADIPATANANATRMFAAGTYTYHCSIHPYMHGTIVAR